MRNSYLTGAITGIATFMLIGMAIAMIPAQQSAPDGAHDHPAIRTSIAEVRIEANSTNSRQGTQIAALQATRQTLPSPTPHTFTPSPPPSRTSTPFATSPDPTSEGEAGLTRTPLTSVPPLPTATRTRTPVATSSAVGTPITFLDPNYTCRIITNDALKRRETPSPAALNLETMPAGTVLTIHPYDGSIPLNSALWYVRIADTSGGGWALYARIDPTVDSREPLVTESYMDSIQEICIPALRRS